MTRLIDADNLKKRIQLAPNKQNETWEELYDSVIDEIDAAPDERPQGFWDISPETEVIAGIEIPAIFRERFCSVCRTEAFYDQGFGYVLSQYCPTCGARLIQEDKDNEQAK